MASRKRKILSWLLAAVILAAVGGHYALSPWGVYRVLPEKEAALRYRLVETAQSWLGTKEGSTGHEEILAIYNSHEPLAVDYVVQPADSWCAAFVSTAAIQCDLTRIIPTECGCERQIELLKAMGRWQEYDGYIPAPGDLIYYDWDQTERGRCTGWSDHVGIVVGIKWPFIKVIEGNREDQVMYRIIPVNAVTIRGFGLPDYASAAREIN